MFQNTLFLACRTQCLNLTNTHVFGLSRFRYKPFWEAVHLCLRFHHYSLHPRNPPHFHSVPPHPPPHTLSTSNPCQSKYYNQTLSNKCLPIFNKALRSTGWCYRYQFPYLPARSVNSFCSKIKLLYPSKNKQPLQSDY